MLSFQNWFYPEQHRDFPYIDHSFKRKMHLIDHQHFQPHLRKDFDCAALVSGGGIKEDQWQWITINCSMKYTDMIVVCEDINRSLPHPPLKYINVLFYDKLSYAKIINTTLVVPHDHCGPQFLHYNGLCESYYVGVINKKKGCQLMTTKQAEASLSTHSPTVTNMFKRILNRHDINMDNVEYLIKCVEPTFTGVSSLRDFLFQCYDGTLIIQHHLCDGEADCPDASDESNCSWVCQFSTTLVKHGNCFRDCVTPICMCHHLYFNCVTGGCIPLSKFCNGIKDCPDASDESLCARDIVSENPVKEHGLFTCISGPQISKRKLNDTVPDCPIHGDDEVWLYTHIRVVINYTMPLAIPCIPGHPKVYWYYEVCLLTWQEPGELAVCRNGAHLSDCVYHSCPDHYKCKYSYCIPLHAVCNGFTDCPDGDDEQNCMVLSCPNTVKCKHDNICIHYNYVNDGVINCPAYEDDEATALLTACPKYCECIGHAAYCTGAPIIGFIHKLSPLKAFIYRSEVNEVKLERTPLYSLRYLDLSNNRFVGNMSTFLQPLHSLIQLIINNVSISQIKPYTFGGLQSVKDLQLPNNPVHIIHTHGFTGLSVLPSLNVSRLSIRTIEKCSFIGLLQLLYLDLSYNQITQIDSGTFCGLELLQILQLQNNSITYVSASVSFIMTQLQVLESSMKGLCCYATIKHCLPKFDDEFASCTSLLDNGILRYIVYIFAVLPVGLNSLSLFVIKLFFGSSKSKKKQVGNIFRKQLILSDGAMGLFFLMLSIYNILYTGDFVTVGHLWRKSIHCRILSVVSMVSIEMTLFIVLFIGIDRFLAMCFPLKNIYISVKSAWSMVVFAWVAAITISLIPSLSMYFNNVELNNAMCITILCFDLLALWIVWSIYLINTIATITNLVLHVAIMKAIHNMQQGMQFSQARRSKELSVTIRIIFLIFTNSSCWLVLGNVSLLYMAGTSISKSMFSSIVTAVLPISTLLNPILNVFTTNEFLIRFGGSRKRQNVRQKMSPR